MGIYIITKKANEAIYPLYNSFNLSCLKNFIIKLKRKATKSFLKIIPNTIPFIYGLHCIVR